MSTAPQIEGRLHQVAALEQAHVGGEGMEKAGSSYDETGGIAEQFLHPGIPHINNGLALITLHGGIAIVAGRGWQNMLADRLLQCAHQVVHFTPMARIQDVATLMKEERLEQETLTVQAREKVDRQVNGPHRRYPIAEGWRQLLRFRVLAMHPPDDS